MPMGHSLSIYARFSGKKRTSMYHSQQKRRSLLYPNTAHRSFFPLQSFSRKNWPKTSVNADASISDHAHAPWASHNIP